MNIKAITLASIFSITALIFNVSGTEAQDYYVQLNSGYIHGFPPKGVFEKGSMGDSAIYGAELGYRINNKLNTSFSIDYRPGFLNNYTVVRYEDDLPIRKNSNIKVSSIASMINLYYNITDSANFTPYLTMGAGISTNQTNNRLIRFTTQNNNTITGVISKYRRTSLAYKIGAGVKISMSTSIDLDLRYQFANLGKFQTGDHFDGYDQNGDLFISETSVKKDGYLKSHEALLGIAYKF